MLTMLPKLALVVMPMYFSVLAKVRRPSSTPWRSTSRSGLQQHDVGALARHVHRLVDRDADIGGVQRRRVVDAVAEKADRVAGALQRAHDALLLLRVDLGEQRRCASACCHSASSCIAGDLLAGEQRCRCPGRRAAATWAATWRLSPVMILTRMPSAARSRSVWRGTGLGRVEKEQEALEAHRRLVGDAVDASARRSRRVARPSTRKPCSLRSRKKLRKPSWATASSGAAAPSRPANWLQAASTLSNAPLVIMRWLRAAALGDDDRQPPAQEVVGNLVDLGQAGGVEALALCRRRRAPRRAGCRCRSPAWR